MENYPRDLPELEARFLSEAACREYLFCLRWPEGFRCPRCGGAEAWPVNGVLLQCASCDRQTSVTAGTIFQDSRLPLTLWFRVAWWVTSQKNGVSAMGFHPATKTCRRGPRLAVRTGLEKLQNGVDAAV